MNSVSVVLKRNWALIALGRKTEARQGLDRVLASDKVHEALVQDAGMKLSQKDYMGGRKSAEEALEKMPDDTSALTELVESYTAQKQKAAAFQRVRGIAAAHPASAVVQLYLGRLLTSDGDRAGGRRAFEAAKSIQPGMIDADFALAELDARDGKVEEARKRLLGVISSHPDNRVAHKFLAQFEMTVGNPAAAIEQYRKVVEIDAKDALSWNSLAYLLAENRRPDEALKCAQKAKELAPDNPAVDDTLGWIYYQQGAYPLAVVHLEGATAKEGTGTAVRKYHLAMAYLKDGKPDRGRQTLEAALKMNPNLPEAQAARQAFEVK